MKVGTENKKTTIAAVVLGILALLFFLRMISSFSGSTEAAAPTASNAAAVNAAAAAASNPNATPGRPNAARQQRPRNARDRRVGVAPAQSLDPRLNLALLEQSEKVVYSGTGRNIFKMEEEPKIEAPVKGAELAPQKLPRVVPQGPQGPPPIPLKFYGWASRPGEPRSVFLSSNGGDVFVAREGEIVDRRYKIVRIQANTVEVEDMLTNNHQNLPLTQG